MVKLYRTRSIYHFISLKIIFHFVRVFFLFFLFLMFDDLYVWGCCRASMLDAVSVFFVRSFAKRKHENLPKKVTRPMYRCLLIQINTIYFEFFSTVFLMVARIRQLWGRIEFPIQASPFCSLIVVFFFFQFDVSMDKRE